MTVRLADITNFDEGQLLDAFHSRRLVPAWVDKIESVPEFPAVAKEVLASDAVKSLEGEWQTDDTAARKFWLNIHVGHLRLHTTKLGFWISTRQPILSADADSLTWAQGEGTMDIRYKKEGNTLTVQVPAPSVFEGEFKLALATE